MRTCCTAIMFFSSRSEVASDAAGKPPFQQLQQRVRVEPKQRADPHQNSELPQCPIRCGQMINSDARLAKIAAREQFLLSVIIPRVRTLGDALQEWSWRSASRSVWLSCAIVLILHVGTLIGCTSEAGSNLCAGYPEGASDDERHWAFTEYGPPMINVLATLMLSFYANVCMNLYQQGYLAAQAHKEAVFDVTAMVAGTIAPEMHEIRVEFWRCINLIHLCSWVLADKQRSTYNVEDFLVPVAMAYGEYDGEARLGMLSADELRLLQSSQSSTGTTDAELAALRHEKRSRDPGQHQARQVLDWPSRIAGAAQQLCSSSQFVPSSTRRAPPAQAKASLANARGDISSPAAALHAALGVRLYMLIDLVLDQKLSRAAWPAWNAVCLKLRSASEGLKHRALFRLPRIYQLSVRFLVASTLLTDTFLLAAHASRLLVHAQAEAEWSAHAFAGAAADLTLNLLLTWCLAVFLDAIGDMQTPFVRRALTHSAHAGCTPALLCRTRLAPRAS